MVNLLRCAWAGSQKYGNVVWSGDVPSTFEAHAAGKAEQADDSQEEQAFISQLQESFGAQNVSVQQEAK